MKRTNRVEPADAVMTITTQLEIIRTVEVVPIVTKLWTNAAMIKHSRKTLCCIACLFITVGILALSIVISGLIVAYGKIHAVKESDIERYDLGDLYYGITNTHQMNSPWNPHLTNVKKIFIKKYLSDQLINEPGYRSLFIDDIFLQNQLTPNRRKQRDTSCSILFIIQNIQIYFDPCLTCLNERNLILHRLFSNITAFQQLLHLLLNDRNIFMKICSLPNIPNLTPIRSNISYAQKLTSSLRLANTNVKYSISSTIVAPMIAFESQFTTEFDLLQTTVSFIDSQTTESSTSTKRTTSHKRSTIKSTAPAKTTSHRFQFLPFRPSTTISPSNLTTKPRTSMQRHNNIR